MRSLMQQFIIPCFLVATTTAAAWGQNQYSSRYPSAEQPPSASKPGFLDKVNHFGKSLVDGVFGPKTPKSQQSGSANRRQPARAGSAGSAPASGTRTYAGSSSAKAGSVPAPGVEPSLSRQVRPRPVDDPSVSAAAGVPGQPPAYEATLSTITSAYRTGSTDPKPAVPAEAKAEIRQPLHKRLADVRQTPVQVAAKPASPAAPEVAAPKDYLPQDAPLSEMTSPLEVEHLLRSDELANPVPRQTNPAPTSSMESFVPVETAPPVGKAPLVETALPVEAAPKSPAADEPAEAVPVSRRPSSSDLLLSKRVPVLSIRTFGPKRINVGKEAMYQITVENAGDADAENAEITIDLPEWADIQETEPTQGIASVATSENGQRRIVWTVDRVRGSYHETLRLCLVPRARKPIDLAVQLHYVPSSAAAVIEVQEPKLAIKLNGPREVAFGKENVYRLEILNSGNGDAENCTIALTPIDAPDAAPDVHDMGTLAAGQRKVVEVELTARQTGMVEVKVAVDAEGGAHAELAEKIVVLRPELEVVAEGPRVKYTDATGLYQVAVVNKGNATARKVVLTARIPAGVSILRCDHSGKKSEDGTQITWTIPTVAPGVKETFSVECHLKKPGYQKFEFEAVADDHIKAGGVAVTQVEAIADLVLKVSDPVGPVATGKKAEYKIHVQNRGTKRAEGVEVVSYFSKGIEPVTVQGQPNTVSPGQVVFSPLASIMPGETVVLTIEAEASIAGNHMFRAEVYCKPLGTRLVTEETTHFYQSQILEAERPQPDMAEIERPDAGEGEESQPLRTANRLPPVAGEANPIRQ